MSIRVIKMVKANGPENASDYLMLLMIAEYASDQGEAWPAVPTLARDCRVKTRAAQKTLRRLETDGWITVEPPGQRRSNTYRVNLDRLATPVLECTPVPEDTPSSSTPLPVLECTPTPVLECTPTPSSSTPEPSMNPHMKNQGTAAPVPSSLTSSPEPTSEASVISGGFKSKGEQALYALIHGTSDAQHRQAADAAEAEKRRMERDAARTRGFDDGPIAEALRTRT